MEAKPPKRFYSKGGCRECKRRKIKCDEGKPQCWQCVRLLKQCLYPLAGERVARVSKRVLLEQIAPLAIAARAVSLAPPVAVPAAMKNPAIINLLNGDMVPPPPVESSFTLAPEDFELLAQDLDAMVSDIVVDKVEQMQLPDLLPPPPPRLPPPARHIDLSYVGVSAPHEKLYLEEFYNNFSLVILPFGAWDAHARKYYNPARDIILKLASHEPFLMAAVLAQGAKLLFKKNDIADDEVAYRQYCSRCLWLLRPATTAAHAALAADLTANIEAVLVTILLLTADTTLNAAPDWRPHLKGARDLLLKLARQQLRPTSVLIFCKLWFIAFEFLAQMLSKNGGTLNEEELDLLLCPNPYEEEVLREIGILRPNGFNIMIGFHHDGIPLFRDLGKQVARRRKARKEAKDKQFPATMEHIRLFSEFYRLLEINFVIDNPVSTMADFPLGIPEGSLIDIVTDDVVVLWMDLLQKLYTIAALVTLLTKFFGEPYTLPQVQLLTSRLTLMLAMFKEHAPQQRMTKCFLMMILWPMYMAGLNCIVDNDKFLLMKFFRAAAGYGVVTAKHALDRVCLTWKLHEEGKLVDDDDDDRDRIDFLSY